MLLQSQLRCISSAVVALWNSAPVLVKNCLGLSYGLVARWQRSLNNCARAGASRGVTLHFGVKTWRQGDVNRRHAAAVAMMIGMKLEL